jgi:hypothetical protein
MADISKCAAMRLDDLECPLREGCDRFLVAPKRHWQSWLAAPFTLDEHGSSHCQMLLPTSPTCAKVEAIGECDRSEIDEADPDAHPGI